MYQGSATKHCAGETLQCRYWAEWKIPTEGVERVRWQVCLDISRTRPALRGLIMKQEVFSKMTIFI